MTTYRFSEDTCIQQAQPKIKNHVFMDSPALDVMTDLSVVKAETIDPKTSISSAEMVMINRGVRALFVTTNFPCVDGLVTATDLRGNKPIDQRHLQQVVHHELCVKDVMTPLSGLDIIDYDELKNAYVDRVVATFDKLKCTHLLVVQRARDEGPARIRGVISVTQLKRQLSKSLMEAYPEPPTKALA